MNNVMPVTRKIVTPKTIKEYFAGNLDDERPTNRIEQANRY